MFGAAAIPEGDRRGTFADYDGGTAEGDRRRCDETGARGRVHERGDGGIPGGCGAEFLFSGNEYAAAGGASGDGAGDVAGFGEAADSDCGGRKTGRCGEGRGHGVAWGWGAG